MAVKAHFVPVAIHHRQPYVSVVRIAAGVGILGMRSLENCDVARIKVPWTGEERSCGGAERWSRLGSNQRPPACEAGALPLSYETGAERRTRSKISTQHATGRKYRPSPESGAPTAPRNLCGPAQVDYRRASHRATISPVARGCSAVGSASPCQGEGRGFESRHPLEGAMASIQRWSGRVVRQRPAKPCTRVRFPSPPPDLFPRRD
jgi:hypothetical protein